MRSNRSVPPCPVIPVLQYPDPSAAAEWLSKAFGFTVRLRIANHRIQMRAGEGCFTIGEGDTVPNRSIIVQVRIEDALSHCERHPARRRVEHRHRHFVSLLEEPKNVAHRSGRGSTLAPVSIHDGE